MAQLPSAATVALLLLLSPSLTLAISDDVTFETREEVPIGTEIGNLKSRLGLPDGATIAMLFPSPEIQQLLKLDAATGLVTTIGRLDREALCPGRQPVCERTFNAEAKRQGDQGEEVVSVKLVVADVNDQRPRFDTKNRQFLVSIPESEVPPSFYSLPTAEDSDSEANAHTKYELSVTGDAAAYFKLAVDEKLRSPLPRLELIRQLDREAQDRYQLQLLASDAEFPGEKDRVDIEVRVLDANDNRPQWQMETRVITVAECDRLHRRLLRLQATDKDLDERITYSVAPTASKLVAASFYVADDYLKQNRSLDYETLQNKVLEIPLVAQDKGGLPSETQIELRVTDCNDHSPNITLQVVDNRVIENDNSEKLLARVLVRDEDEGNNGTVDCRVGEGQGKLFELVGRKAGTANRAAIYRLVKRAQVRFDREATPSGEVAVDIICSDRNDHPRVSRKELRVKIVDVNDNQPKFEQARYRFHLLENNQPGALVGRVAAIDSDEGENSRLTFELDSAGRQFFELRTASRSAGWDRAEIYARAPFDREERSVYQFAVTAADAAAKDSLTSTASVEVVLGDLDDSAPVFKSPDYTFRIVEDYGTNVSRRRPIGTVEATDADEGVNAEIRFRVGPLFQHAGGVSFAFEGNRLFGEGNFDRERQETITLEVLAFSGFGGERSPMQRSSSRVTIVLLDLNDNRPVLEGLERTYNLSVASPAGTQVLQARGRDSDAGENGTVVYGLKEGDGEATVEVGRGYFSVDPTHGMVTLVRGVKEVGRHFRLVLEARDTGVSPLSSSYTVFVHTVTEAASASAGGSAEGSGGGVGSDGAGSGAAGGRTQRAEADRNLLLLLCLAAMVFVIFVALLAVLLYMHAWGGRSDSTRTVRENRGAWYDRANGEMQVEEPSVDATDAFRFPDILTTHAGATSGSNDCGSGGGGGSGGYRAGTLVIDNARARSPGCLRKQQKFHSFGYLASPSAIAAASSLGGASTASTPDRRRQQQQQRSMTLKALNGYETTTERLPRKFYATIASRGGGGDNSGANNGASASSAFAGAACADPLMDRDAEAPPGSVVVEENKYATAAFRPGRSAASERHGYAVLASEAAMRAAGSEVVTNPLCRTPFVTSSFV